MIKIIESKNNTCNNVPWEDKTTNSSETIWRFSKNPVIPRNLLQNSNSIFNSAVVPFGNQFAGVFRCDDTRRYMRIHRGLSENGLDWKIDETPIKFIPSTESIKEFSFDFAYDPRVCFIDDRYYITWCNGLNGEPTIGMAYTHDFESFYQLENAYLPHNRNGVLFPRKINGLYVMLNRPSDNGHTRFGDIYLSQSPDLTFWGKHRFVMDACGPGWQSTKIGAGPIPIETTEGWLVFYHGVLTSCNGFVYSMGAALLDLDEPWKIIYRSEPYLLSPQTQYECVGDVPNVVFPCAAVTEHESGKIAIYYGAADTVSGIAFTKVDLVFDFLKKNALK